ncbi:ribosomal RNA small subunit methyltransferase A [Candidatus Berkelbacteria bacterium CG08_land_8_20_14_0_20_39_8]|uniref:Ribosomal RNA small subunit methyltransferase A n=1 Tax=Candidatus Berkelbacteria bacterium CG08_land_8_20_14_0_20_39_8 TaxID=1974511 RepID=A0A2M6YCB8_9BACT|nr:MAG: ribosomal RNA small subunit methyltransferase A [Candidatus Berkelbacteria bacterium CG08_land_8_20_14_0_20_39_8]
MGQNFLVDGEVLAKIIETADISLSDTILEIGPGLGVLTEGLSEKAGNVIAVEKDDKLAEMLKSKFSVSNVKVLNQDALEFDSSNLGKYKLVANIPYNITSMVIQKFLETKNKPNVMVLMVQKEVAERITAEPGDMSLLSISVQFYATAKIIDIVPKESFFPLPKVDSAIIKIESKKQKTGNKSVQARDFFRMVKFGFAAKRKTLENNLAAGMCISKIEASDIIKRVGLSEKIRAEELSIEDWERLYKIASTDVV